MAINFINKALSDKFTEDTVKGAGAIKGKDGFSPIAKVKKENGKSTISITDKNGTTSAEVYDGKESEHRNTFNAIELGLVPDNGQDQTDKLNEILASMPNDFVLFIPRGTYIISDTITCGRSGSIVGEKYLVYPSEQWDNKGTIFAIDATSMASNYVIDTTNMYRVSISGICFRCNSYTLTEDRSLIPKGDSPKDFYTRTVNKADINCIKLTASHSVVENCAFWGFSGYAITKASVGNYIIRNCYFNQCNIAIKTGVDSVISEITAVYCNTIVEADGSTNIISNVRGDSIAGHAFILTGNNNALSEFMIDICLYSAILIKGGHNYIDGCVGRCGAYYSGFNADDVEEVEKGSGICFEGYNANNNLINVTCPNKTLKDGNPSDKNLYTAPAIKIATKSGNPLNNEINISGEMKDEVNSDAQKAGTILSYEKLCELHGLGKGSSINERGTVINYRGVKYEFILYSRASDGSINATRVIANNIQNYNKNTKNGIVPIRLGLITEDADGNVYISVGTNSVSDWKKL